MDTKFLNREIHEIREKFSCKKDRLILESFAYFAYFAVKNPSREIFLCRQNAGSTLNSTKPAVAAGVFFQGGEEVRLAEVGPEGRGDDQFGVADLPQQEIAHAHFTAGAN